MIKFQEGSFKNHVIHKVNFMVITFSNLNKNDIFGILVKLPVHQYQFYEYWVTHSSDLYEGSKVGNCKKKPTTDLLEKNKGNIKETWKIINCLINKKVKEQLPNII